jgi:uncharacterized membrane protein
MALLVLALGVFAIIQFVPAVPIWKAVLKSVLGRGYGPVYGVASLFGLVLMIWAFRHAERYDFYDPPAWGRHANFLLTLVAFVLLGVFLGRGQWRNTLRYPAAFAIVFWGFGHLLANGDNVSLVFFGGMIVVAIVQVLLMRGNVPFVGSEVRKGHNLFSVLVGVAIYAVFVQLHGVVIGVPVLNLAH